MVKRLKVHCEIRILKKLEVILWRHSKFQRTNLNLTFNAILATENNNRIK